MKIQLRSKKGVEVLEVEGPVADFEAQILRVGVTRLLRNGKNRIILDLSKMLHQASRLPDFFLTELLALDRMARDLAGRIALAGVPPLLHERLAHLSKPPLIDAYTDLGEAILSFLPPVAVTQRVELREGSVTPQDLQALRDEIKMLHGLVHKWVIHRRATTEPTADRIKIHSLEKQIADLVAQSKALPKSQV